MRVLNASIVIVERQAEQANRLDITSFTVDAVAKLVTIAGRGVHFDVDGTTALSAALLPETRVGGDDVYALMAAGAKNVTVNVLTALGVSPALIAQVVAGCDSHPDAAADAYYGGTRDALYDAVERALATQR